MRTFLVIVAFALCVLLPVALCTVPASSPLATAGFVLYTFGYIGLSAAPLLQRRDRSGRLSRRQMEALLKAWDDFDLGRNRPEPPRRPEGRGAMWDEWLDGDHTPRLPTRQKNPRGHPRGDSRT
jgi:hypothetical protein